MKSVEELREGFTWDSPVPLPWLITGALAVMVWLAVLAFAEWRMAKRPAFLPFLWLLRAAAVVALALALAGPSKTLTRRETTRQAVSILVDTSASMTLTDHDADVPGWTKGGPDDSAFGQLTAARHHLRRLSAMPPGQWGTPSGEQRWADASAALQKAAGAGAPEDLRQAAGRFAETAAAFTSSQSVLARDCLRVIVEAEAAAADRIKALEPAASGAPGSSAGEAESRLKRTADWLAAAESGWLKECREEFDVTVYDAGEIMVPAAAGTLEKWRAATGESLPQRTDLSAVLDEAARDAALGQTRAIVLVTDGGHNAKRDAEAAAERLRGLPLLLVPAGATGGAVEKDLSLPSLLAPATVYKNDSMRIEALVTATGCEGESVEAVLKEGERKIESRLFRIRDGAPEMPLEFMWKPERLGRHQLQVELSVLKDETSPDNNRQEITVEVLEDTLRLLIADREPRWETRYLLNLMKRDMRMEFETMLFAPQYNPETATDTPPPVFPFTLDGWAQYRIVILGDVTPEHLTPEQQALLVKYVVDRGGTLILVAGDQAMPAAYDAQPLGRLIPVTRVPYLQGDAYAIALSMEGREMDPGRLADTAEESDRVWREATRKLPVYDLSEYSKPKPQAHVLLRALSENKADSTTDRAFLTWQDAGKGRVIYLAAPVSWHLRYLSGDKWHYRFWGQLLQWSVSRTMSGGSRTVHLAADRSRVPQDAPLHMILRLEDLLGKPVTNAEARAVLRTGSGLEKSAPFSPDEKVPGTYRALLTGLPAGAQRIAVEGPEIDRLLREEGRQGKIDTLVTVDPPENRELREVFCDMSRIRRLATAAEGAVLPPGAVAEALKNLGLRPSVIEQTALTPVWNEWPWLGLILGFLILEWILRKPAGLV